MAPPPTYRIELTLRWLHKRFEEYYRGARVTIPPEMARREFGYIPFPRPGDGQMMIRHLGFLNPKELVTDIRRRAPWHIYHSVAYYRRPDARTMADKEWQGADLIFDLDAPHLSGAKDLDHAQMLDLVKGEFLKLVFDYALGDFGFKEEHMQVVFSGSKGYHLHVRDPSLRQMDSGDRRELIDYLVATGLSVDHLFPREGIKATSFGRSITVKETRRFPPLDSLGWRKKYIDAIPGLLERWAALERSELVKEWLTTGRIKRQMAISIADHLFTGASGDRPMDAIIANHSIDVFKRPQHLQVFLEVLLATLTPALAGHIDEPVTADIKRLIRLPGSLHGKTCLRVTPLEFKDLDDFDPLSMAVALPDTPVTIECSKQQRIRIGDFEGEVGPGDNEVPLYAAAYLIGNRNGLIKT